MSDPLETTLRDALQSRVEELDTDGVTRILAVDYTDQGRLGNRTFRRRDVMRRLAPFSLSSRRGVLATCGAIGFTAIVAAVAIAVALGSTAAPALAGWTATPTAPARTGQAAEALRRCGAPQPLLIDTRARFTAVLFQRSGQQRFCITQAGVPLYGGGGGALTSAKPKSDAVTVEGAGSIDGSGNVPITLYYGRAGANVTGVRIILNSGSPVTATVRHGWYLAWWPGQRRATGLSVTTTSGTRTEPLNGPAPANACAQTTGNCPDSKAPTADAPDISHDALFRAAADPAVPVAQLKLDPKGQFRYLDTSTALTAIANLIGIAGHGTEVCVLLRHNAPNGHLSGSCTGPNMTATQTPVFTTGRAGTALPRQSTPLAGLIPDKITQIIVERQNRAPVTLTVRHNAIAALIDGTVTAVRWQDADGTAHRQTL